jgi:hypothetical protein
METADIEQGVCAQYIDRRLEDYLKKIKVDNV